MSILFNALKLLSRNLPTPQPVQELNRSYASAMIGRLTSDFNDSLTSADSEISSSLRTLRARSRQLVRDNDYARHAVRYIAQNIIGAGVDLIPNVRKRDGTLNKKMNDAIRQAWAEWMCADQCDIAGKLSFADIELLAIKSLVENGEVLFRKYSQRAGDSSIPFSIGLLEADMLIDDYTTSRLPNGNIVRHGIETTSVGRPVAYHLYSHHPGDMLWQSLQNTGLPNRIQASEIIHAYIPERIGQSRGVPWLSSAILRMKNLGGYESAEIIRARASANVMGIIQSPEAPTPELIENNQRQEFMEPGEIKHLLPGESWDFANPSAPNPTAGPFIAYMLRGAAAGLGISYAGLTGDYSDTNYSSSRLGQYGERDYFRTIQAWYIRTVRANIHRDFIRQCFLSGRLSAPDYEERTKEYEAAIFRPRGWGWTQPKDDVPAYLAARRAGFMTTEQIVSETAGSSMAIEDLYSHLADENKIAEDLGLKLDADPSRIDGSGKTQIVTTQTITESTTTAP